MFVRRAIAAVGRTMISVGLLLLLFVAYQLWGTSFAHARDQRRLKSEAEVQLSAAGVSLDAFDALDALGRPAGSDPVDLGDDPTVSSIRASDTAPSRTTLAVPAETTPAIPTTTVFVSRRPQVKPKAGDVLGIIKIPKIGVREAFVKGTEVKDLQKGPGHYEHTPLPGQPGNAALAGHRTTFGAPFYRFDELRPGDAIFVATVQGVFRYNVTETTIVSPKNVSVLRTKPGRNTLTLTTCHPRFSAAKRMVVTADLVGEAAAAEVAADPVPDTTITTEATTTSPSADTLAPSSLVPSSLVPSSVVPTTGAPTRPSPTNTQPANDDAVSLESAGGARTHRVWVLAGSASAWMHSFAWAGLCAIVWIGAWLFARRRRLWRQAAIYSGSFIVLFTPPLFFCFVNLTRLLPENV